jgi:autotransporter-associated beta strand protein
MLTGQYPQRFGYENNIANSAGAALSQGLTADNITLAQRLKPLGYTTGVIGKWHLGQTAGVNRPLDKGFDEFYGLLGGSRSYFSHPTQEEGIWKNDQYYEAQYRTEGDTSRYDPVKGRYLTDAFGEEAASFINRHADDENPFFLYLPLTGPHTPFEAKQQDLDRFAHITDPTRKNIAAMTYAVDRAVGDVMNALEANGIDDETIVMFYNDNGADYYVLNPPFRGHKGTSYEGGIRVPFFIKGPGLTPGVNNSVITGLDLAPTILTAAGGDITQFDHDGYDVMPQLKGEASTDPNAVYFWRNFETYAIRKGDWKLTVAYIGGPGRWLHNVRQNPNENVFLQDVRKDIVADLARELTKLEAQMEKPKWGDLGAKNQNLFDHFVYRNNLADVGVWSTADSWNQGGTQNVATLKPADAYANAILEFGVRNDANYTAQNNMKRMSREVFMLNELRLTGSFNGASPRQGLINGNAVLFVNNLDGQAPRINLQAASSGSEKFTFRVNTEIQLFHDLEITGDGNQNFVIGGQIRDYYDASMPSYTQPHSVRKTGTSIVTLVNNNTFAGSLTVASGEVVIDTAAGAINGAQSITLNSGAVLRMRNGLIKVPTISVEPGAALLVEGGLLETKTVNGSFVLNQGTFAPGLGTAITNISESFAKSGGVLQVQIGGTKPGTGYDQLQIGNTAVIAGGLQVQFAPGFTPVLYQTFEILTAGNVIGTFTNHDLPTLPNGLSWRVLYTTSGISLTVRPPGQSNNVVPVGDYNADGTVDAADYTVWRDTVGSTTMLDADGNGDHVVNDLDLNVWKSHFGESFTGIGGDFNLDGAVDAADYNLWREGLEAISAQDYNEDWRSSFGTTLGGGSASLAVPEPAALGSWFTAILFVAASVRFK